MITKESIRSIWVSTITTLESFKNITPHDPKFMAWEDSVYRKLIRIYGEDSYEIKSFGAIKFNKTSHTFEEDEIELHMADCLLQAKLFLESLIEELELLPRSNFVEGGEKNGARKIFISHSSQDKTIASEIVQLLSLIGIKDSCIFCTSLEGHGIPLGEDWLQTLKSEISGDAIVLFVISENYFKSAVSLCEMGAAWALSKKHIPILVPPMDYNQMSGVIPLTQGFKITEPNKWTILKTQLENLFNLTPKAPEIWEGRRNQILARIDRLFNP
ncbi:toll/interleukin-1 receptor domain-containing protein [Arthrospiribacter ruber]|nr:toll/interleukin-1 receptor domain-containing protein [Arthrospiribacter ruber]